MSNVKENINFLAVNRRVVYKCYTVRRYMASKIYTPKGIVDEFVTNRYNIYISKKNCNNIPYLKPTQVCG